MKIQNFGMVILLPGFVYWLQDQTTARLGNTNEGGWNFPPKQGKRNRSPASKLLSLFKQILWVLAVIIGVSGIIGHLTHVKYLTEYKFVLVMVGFILLVIGTMFKKA